MTYWRLPTLMLILGLLALPAGSAQAGPVPLLLGEGPAASAPARAHGVANDEDRDDEDDGYTLSAAYPNPFRSLTKFDLHVEKPQRVSVEIYNILGQRVRTIYEGHMAGGQKRTFTLEARNLPSGLYLYRIKGETFTAARRVTLVR